MYLQLPYYSTAEKATQWCTVLTWLASPSKHQITYSTAIHNRSERTWLWEPALVTVTFFWTSHHGQGIWNELIAYPNIWAFVKWSGDHISICICFHKSAWLEFFPCLFGSLLMSLCPRAKLFAPWGFSPGDKWTGVGRYDKKIRSIIGSTRKRHRKIHVSVHMLLHIQDTHTRTQRM